MSRKKKHKHHEEHIDESWLIPYADLLTLLLALFIVLFAASSVDVVKFKQIAYSLNSAFNGGTGVMKYPSVVQQSPEDIPSDEENEGNQGEEENQEEIDEEAYEELEQKELKELQEKINGYILDNKLNEHLETKLTDEGLLVTILNDTFFNSGSAAVRPADQQLAKEISELLVMNPPRNIIVSGHTDNVPISNSQFDNNWHLSVMRAINFMKILLENEQLDHKSFSAKGFGEYSPVAPNNTAEGRMKNRRVEILILPNVIN
ncbi:flagellar motor protein MotB [Bacillus luteolus]|uniref:Flagellar motor protein MotB n=1 Tax=Litchfieldia luteola TaxID=682179 RepID=A0ABR9QMA7_9BACI|nr:flagellar motor protein MotB [Cytobacillus luteolus]MBE4909541.1 flagellar motor protein MotB [Cytobacillus luteolus]MBP1940942.1 chemotaxis protein MotB [Cytobacillus luteolus]